MSGRGTRQVHSPHTHPRKRNTMSDIFETQAQRDEFFEHVGDIVTFGCPFTCDYRFILKAFARGEMNEAAIPNSRVLDGMRRALSEYIRLYCPRAVALVERNDWESFSNAFINDLI
jgi:hypothetical protein